MTRSPLSLPEVAPAQTPASERSLSHRVRKPFTARWARRTSDMRSTRLLMSGLIAFGLAWNPTGVVAAEPHGHAATAKISLDHGKKWPTDEALRRGMGEIRNAMADALPAIHRDKLSGGEFEKLAGRVQGQVDYVTANCKSPDSRPTDQHRGRSGTSRDGIAAMKSDKRLLQQQRRLGADRVAPFRPVDGDQRGAVGVVFDQDFWHGAIPLSSCQDCRPRAGGGPSTPRLIDLIADVSGILDHPLSRVTTSERTSHAQHHSAA